jgi:predicted TIM-barrel enzyme
VLVSGMMTGMAAETSDLQAVKQVLKDTPVFANTGVTIDNIRDILAVGDGCIVGTHFKVDGNTWNAVDGERVKRFMDLVRQVR